MGFWEALLLGIIQGLTEFLPVSSSGHLALFSTLLGNDMLPEEHLFFTLLVHAATALATIVVFRKDIFHLITGIVQKKNTAARSFAGHILISMIPAVIVGLFLEEEITSLFGNNLALVGAMLCLTAVLLYFTDKSTSKKQPISYLVALLIGFAQAIAILPGISRSGATIATAVLLGIAKPDAARFSFLMVIPLILGSMAKTLLDYGSVVFSNIEWVPLITGFIASLVSGIFACTWMIALVKRSKLSYFAAYCLLVGLIALGITWMP